MNEWIQSKYSKDAKKWELVLQTGIEDGDVWAVRNGFGRLPIYLPKEDYVLCDPPERWEVCTRNIVKVHSEDLQESYITIESCTSVFLNEKERWAWSKKDPDALVIERKVS